MKAKARLPAFPVVEFAGLPGAGKSTICGLVSLPHRTKSTIPLREWRPRRSTFAVARDLLALCVSARPFHWSRFVRSFNLIVLLRCYEPADLPTILEQGLLHKIWSVLMDADRFPEKQVQRLMQHIKPFAPQILVWVDAPLEAAALRVSQRLHGRSRFDGLPLTELQTQLARKSQLLDQLLKLYRQQTEAALLRLDGMSPAIENARRIDELLRAPHSAALTREGRPSAEGLPTPV